MLPLWLPNGVDFLFFVWAFPQAEEGVQGRVALCQAVAAVHVCSIGLLLSVVRIWCVQA